MIVPTQATLTSYDTAVSLERYAAIIEMDECAFWGVYNSASPQPGCRTIWTKPQRDDVARYLLEAQDEIEQQVNYPLHPKWFADERQNYACPVMSDWGYVIEPGIRAVADVALAEAVSHATDPAQVGPAATTVTDINEIRVYHPGTDIEINPSSVTISGGNVTIMIPRCRLVKPEYADNPETGLDYNDLTLFEAEVDVKRVYNDPSVNATLVWPHGCAGCANCSEETQSACMYVRHAKNGFFDVTPATYSDGVWRKTNCFSCRRTPEIIRLNYRAGLNPLTPQVEDTIIRLAHAKMPNELCGCETFSRMWRRDRFVPEVLTRERLNNPYGLSDGSWIAWRFTLSFRLTRGYTF
jgi:hypothetical protein